MGLVEYTISLLNRDGWQRKFGFLPNQSISIVHIGANSGQEVNEYEQHGWTAYHVEALPDLFKVLSEKCLRTKNQYAIEACLSDRSGQEVTFHIANNEGQSSSLLPLGRHAHAYPSIQYTSQIKLNTRTIDELISNQIIPTNIDIDVLVIDVQGAELKVLKGGVHLLQNMNLKALIIESSLSELYEGGSEFYDICSYLKIFDIYLLETKFNLQGWTNAIFARRWWPHTYDQINISTKGTNIAHTAMCLASSYGSQCSISSIQRLVDGVRGEDFAFHTKLEKNPWVALDFREVISFDEILVFNRIDYCSQRARNHQVDISQDGKNWTQLYIGKNYDFGGIDGYPLRILCLGTQSQYIRFMLLEEQYLHLNSIEVYRY